MANTSDIVYTMRDDLANWMSVRGYGDNVYVVEAAIDEVVGQYAIQLIPGTDTAVHPNSGVGMVRSAIDIVVWWRGFFDPMQRGTERIAGQQGIQQFVAQLREYLVQRRYDGMLVPLIWRNGGNVEAVAELEGWLTLRDSYDYCYEMEWTVKA